VADSIYDFESEPVGDGPAAAVASAAEPVRAAVETTRTEATRSLLEFLRPNDRYLRRQERFIESLNEVAEAISSTKSIPDILSTVVDETKRLIDTDKAVLCLFDSAVGELSIDDRTLFVRGRREQYPEVWWREQLAQVSRTVIEQRTPITSMADGTWIMAVPVKTKGRAIGMLTVMNPRSRRFTSDQTALIAILGALAGSAIENSRLYDESHYALLSDERARIAQEMHDGLSQSLFSVSLELDVCRKRVLAHPEEVERRLEHLQGVLHRSLGELRRYIYDLRPISLSTLGLPGAINQRVTEIAEARGLSVRVYNEGSERPLPPGVEACLYRVAQEAISNVAKHATAERAVVVLQFRASDVRLVIEDDGHGFDVELAQERSERDDSIGLRSMRQRVESQGGKFVMSSGDRGSTIEVEVPC
jgi:signal transduction histidine kinase